MSITPHVLMGFVIVANAQRLKVRYRQKFKKRWLLVGIICLASFISHFVIDNIPHSDYGIYESGFWGMVWSAYKLTVDCLLAVLGLMFSFRKLPLPEKASDRFYYIRSLRQKIYSSLVVIAPCELFALAAIFSLSPDILIALSRMTGGHHFAAFTRFHDYLHSSVKLDIYRGFFYQFLASAALVWLLKKSNRWLLRDIDAEVAGWEVEAALTLAQKGKK